MDAPGARWHVPRMASPLLVTIAFSHFCDKARWALDRAGIAYRESAHLPVFHAIAALGAGGRRTVPVLVTDDGIFPDSTDILGWVDRQNPDLGLYGKTPEERREIAALEDHFDEDLGPHTRRWGYFYVLPYNALALGMCERQGDTPAWERRAMPYVFPLVRGFMLRAMGIDAESAARSLLQVEAVFDEVRDRLADGRRYLVGDAFTAADLTFAALAAPVLLPGEPFFRMPPLSALAEPAAERIRVFSAHPAGAFALRLAREHRHERVG
jgi:glutathione S-transferase